MSLVNTSLYANRASSLSLLLILLVQSSMSLIPGVSVGNNTLLGYRLPEIGLTHLMSTYVL